MTLATNYDHTGLDQSDQHVLEAYARQINGLEHTAGATPDYDAGLEQVFNQIKALMQNDRAAGSSHIDGSSPEASPSDAGASSTSHDDAPPSGDGDGAAPIGPPVPNPAPAERASIDQIASTAGPGTAAAVQQIADGAAATVGGGAGSALANRVAQAGAQAAQHLIDTGGTPADAQTAATTAARAVATAGAAGGPDAANQVFQIGAVVDPATAAQVSQIASRIAGIIEGSAGAAIAAAAISAASNAATVASVSGLGATAMANAAITAAQAVSSAAIASVTANGLTAGATGAATTAAQAIARAAGFGGAAAANSVSQVAIRAGVPAAQNVAQAAANAFNFAGGKPGGPAAISAATDTAELGATAAQTANFRNAANASPAPSVNAASATLATSLIATTASVGGIALVQAVAPILNLGSVFNFPVSAVSQLVDNVTKAYKAHGIDAAQAVANATDQAFNDTMFATGTGIFVTDAVVNISNIVSTAVVSSGASIVDDVLTAIKAVGHAGGTPAAMQRAGRAISQAFEIGGQAAADSTANALQAVANAGGSVANMSKAATAIIRSFADVGGQSGADAVIRTINATQSRRPDLLNDVISVTGNVAASGASTDSITAARINITRIFNRQGRNAADAISGFIDNAHLNSVNHLPEFANTVLQTGLRGGPSLAHDASQVATIVAENGGSSDSVEAVSLFLQDAFTGGRQAAADSVVSVARSVEAAGGTGDQIAQAGLMLGQRTHLEALAHQSEQAAVQYASSTADSLSRAARSGDSAEFLLRLISAGTII